MKSHKYLGPLSVLLSLLFLMSCESVSSHNSLISSSYIEVPMVKIIEDVYTDKSRYNPNDDVEISVEFRNTLQTDQTGQLTIRLIDFLDTKVTKTVDSITVPAEERLTQKVVIRVPQEDFVGYLVKVDYVVQNSVVDSMVTALDVSSSWSKFPRYGYLVNYAEKPMSSIEATLKDLTKFHINGLQYYDWQDTHHQPLKLDESGNPLAQWTELSNRSVSFQTVKNYIDIGHTQNIMSMNYNLLFGSYDHPEADGVDTAWGQFIDTKGTQIDNHPLPTIWETSRLLLMDPGNALWQDYIFEQEQIVFDHLNFDGWHIDQLGDRGTRYTSTGKPISMISSYINFINNAKSDLDVHLLFNSVDGYGQSEFAKNANLDFLYQEVWSDKSYSSLKSIIDSAVFSSNYTKSIILAAYMNYGSNSQMGFFNTPAILLTNATIFASGGAHLELGDTGMLGSEYFPNNNLKISAELRLKLRDYYDFLVAYQNILRDGMKNAYNKVELEGLEVSTLGSSDKVWYFSKENDEYTAVHLINLLGNQNDWRDDKMEKNRPDKLTNIPIKVFYDQPFKDIAFVSPDVNQGIPQIVSYTTGNEDGKNYLSFTLPSLEYWDMVVIRK